MNAVFMTGALAAAALTVMHFVHSGWPLANADPVLVVAAGILFLFAYAFKAWGWQRLFTEDERPEALTLAAAGGAASVGGVALPGRFDEAIRIAVVRRGPGKKTAGLGAICLTLIIVGLLDSAALAPMASVAAAGSHRGGVQVGFALVAAAGVAAALLVLFLPRIAGLTSSAAGRSAAGCRSTRLAGAPPRRPGSSSRSRGRFAGSQSSSCSMPSRSARRSRWRSRSSVLRPPRPHCRSLLRVRPPRPAPGPRS